MTKRERLCAWCREPVRRKSANGPVPTYCRQSCRQRAYEARRLDEAVTQAWNESLLAAGASLGGPNPSRDDSVDAPDLSRDKSGASETAGRSDVRPAAPVRPALPTSRGRRGGSAGQMLPLWPPGGAE